MAYRTGLVCGISIVAVLAAAPAMAADRIIIDAGESQTFENAEYSEYDAADQNGGVVSNAGRLDIKSDVTMSANAPANGGAIY